MSAFGKQPGGGDVSFLRYVTGADFQRKLVDGLAGIVVAPNRVSVLSDPDIATKLPPAPILAEQSKGILAWPGTPYDINAIFQLAISQPLQGHLDARRSAATRRSRPPTTRSSSTSPPSRTLTRAASVDSRSAPPIPIRGRPAVRLGLLLPQGYFNEFDGWNPHDAYRRVLAIAQEAERRGFDSIWLGEHVLAKWNREEIAFDCVSLATALAPRSRASRSASRSINSTFRNPAMTAKAAGTIDAVSGGRLVLGLGAGFKVNEADAFGHAFPDLPTRMDILSEHFEIISRMTRRDGPAVHVPRRRTPGSTTASTRRRPAAATTSRC